MKKLIYKLIEKFFPTVIYPEENNKAKEAILREDRLEVAEKADYVLYITEDKLKKEYNSFCNATGRTKTDKECDAIISLLKEHINYDTFREKEETLKKIYEDGVYICNLLKPLQLMGIDVTIDVVGGAVRDFLLDRDIRDIDIMVSFSESEAKKVSEPIMLKAGFTAEEISLIDWQYFKETNQSAKCKLIQLCVIKGQREHNLSLSHLKKRESEYEEIIDRLEGVIKVHKIKTHYEIDLLITDLIKPHFISLMDYNICKASFCLKNSFYKKDIPTDHMQLLSRCVTGIPFFNDVYNKTISMSFLNKNENDIKTSIDKHFPKIEKKYSDYKFTVDSEATQPLAQFAQAYYEKAKLINMVAPETVAKTKKNFKL